MLTAHRTRLANDDVFELGHRTVITLFAPVARRSRRFIKALILRGLLLERQ